MIRNMANLQVVSEFIIPGAGRKALVVSEAGASAKSFTLKRGQHVRIVPFEGPQCGDLVAFNLQSLKKEKLSQARTKVNQQKVYVSKGDKIYSELNRVMFTITEDTYGFHDLQKGRCSKWVFENVKAVSDHNKIVERFGRFLAWGCWENLASALKEWNIEYYETPDPFNVFQKCHIDERGGLHLLPTETTPDDFIEMRAEMDLLVAISACPASYGRSLRLHILE
jgi:uncharacterized protein YcgI (DUF1989 family)